MPKIVKPISRGKGSGVALSDLEAISWSEICNVLSISIQDFIKGSIILQMKQVSMYNKDHDSWGRIINTIAPEEMRSQIRQEQHNILSS